MNLAVGLSGDIAGEHLLWNSAGFYVGTQSLTIQLSDDLSSLQSYREAFSRIVSQALNEPAA